MKNYLDHILVSAAFLLSSVSCDGIRNGPDAVPAGGGTFMTEFSGYAGEVPALPSEESVSEITAFHFVGGRLAGTYMPEPGQAFDLAVEKLSGTMYVVAGTPGAPGYEKPGSGVSESEWLLSVVSAGDWGTGIYYTGKADLDGAVSSVIPVRLERGVARFDLDVDVKGNAEVKEIVFLNARQDAYLFGPSLTGGKLNPDDASEGSIRVDFDEPLTSSREGVAYILPQDNASLSVSVTAVVDGTEHVLESPLPEKISRNTVYSLTLRKDSAGGSLSLSVAEWGDGGATGMFPDRDRPIAVDPVSGALPEGAVLSDDGRTLSLPYGMSEFILSIDSDDELEVLPFEGHLLSIAPAGDGGTDVSGVASLQTVRPRVGTSFGSVNRFLVRKGLYAPNVPAQDVEIRFHRKGLSHSYPDDAITLRLEANPTLFEGNMSFDNEKYTHDFGRYADNEFGVFTLPDGKEILAEFPEGEDPWLKVSAVEDGALSPEGRAFRVLGGWRPNDPKADGREQRAAIVIRNAADGSDREEYVIVRRNYGLPVTWLHGVWWCKYNAMGDSRSFEDQILSSGDPAAEAGMTLFDYLSSCSPEEYRRLWGWSYIGDTGIGMQVIDDNGIPALEGYKGGQTVHINRLPADALSPDGYELPSMEDFNRVFDATDYVWVMWNGTHHLKNPWNGHFEIKRVQKRKNGIQVGSLELSDLIYIAMYSPDYPEHEPVVWYGPGAQWNTSDGIRHNGHHNNILFGVHSPQGQGWFIAGGMENLYLHKNGAGNNDTRILRFKKSDVEYIY